MEERLLKEVKKAAKQLKAKNLGCIEDFESELNQYEPQVKGPSITIDIKGKYRRSTKEESPTSVQLVVPKPMKRTGLEIEPYGEVAISLDKKLMARLTDPPALPSVSALPLSTLKVDANEVKESARSIQSLVEMPHLARQFPLAIDLVREHCEKRESKNQTKRGGNGQMLREAV